VQAIFKIMKEPGTSSPLHAKLQNGIKCKTSKSGSYTKITARMACKLCIKVKDTYEEFVTYSSDSLFRLMPYSKYLFIHCIIRGPVSLYCYYSYNSYSFPGGGGSFGVGSGMYSGSTLTKEYTLIKDDGNFMRFTDGAKRKDLMEFFEEYDELVQKLENKEIRPRELDRIVNEYNVWRIKEDFGSD